MNDAETVEAQTPAPVALQPVVRSPRYWVCIIGPVPDDALPDGADFPPRIAARQQVLKMTGHDPVCSSGWCDEAEYKRIQKAQYDSAARTPNNDSTTTVR